MRPYLNHERRRCSTCPIAPRCAEDSERAAAFRREACLRTPKPATKSKRIRQASDCPDAAVYHAILDHDPSDILVPKKSPCGAPIIPAPRCRRAEKSAEVPYEGAWFWHRMLSEETRS